MKFFPILPLILGIYWIMVCEQKGDTIDERKIVVETFLSSKPGEFPKGWSSKRGKEALAIYTVRRERDDAFLEAVSKNAAISIGKEISFNPRDYTILSWRWRTIKLPKGGDERLKKTGDSAAGVYVIFPNFIQPKAIKYVWSSSLPIGFTTPSPYSSKTLIVVLRNHLSPLNQWVTEEVDIYSDFKALFGEEPSMVKGIAIMSDSDNTNSEAIAHYDDIVIKRSPED